ncbi:MAG: type II toxin-antitoxin system Phd/YefM family antitoxin [Stenotrophobium sp.]
MEVGIYEAKTHFPKLLARVARGERVTITRHGKAVAELGPVSGQPDRAKLDALFAQMDAYRATRPKRKNPITIKEILAARDEGRR